MAGRPTSHWLRWFLLTHQAGQHTWTRLEWPDGGATIFQPWPLVAAFGYIAQELNAIEAERKKKQA